jgi:hypothetical protein
MTTRYRQYAVFGWLFVGFFVFNVVMTHQLFTAQFPGQNDFLSRWEGARGFWLEGINPYSEQATLNIQTRIFGRPAVQGEDLGLFVYPFYTVFVIAPTVFFAYAWAAAIIIVALEACLLTSLFLLLSVFAWRPRPIVLGMLVLWTLFNYFAARGIFLGQLGILVYACFVLALWSLARRHDALAGVVLALATIKPQMGYLLIPFLLLWGWRVRRYRLIVGFAVTFGALMIASFVLVPSWLGEWLAQVQLYPSYTRDGSPVWIIVQHYFGLGNIAEGVVNVLCGLFVAYLWYGILVQNKSERFLWTIVMTLIMTNIFSLKTATPHFVVFIIPMVFYLRQVSRRKQGTAWVTVLLGLTLIIPWVHFLSTIDGRLENLAVFLPAPLILLIVTWVTRQMWWTYAPMLDFTQPKSETPR